MPVLLIHDTKPEILEQILAAGKIRSASEFNASKKSKRYLFTYLGILFNHISLFPSNIKAPRHFENKSILFFENKLLEDMKPICYSPTWRFGDCSKKDSFKYNAAKTPDENIEIWEEAYKLHTLKRKAVNKTAKNNNFKLYKPLESFGQNELVFNNSIPLDHCVAIFQLNATFSVPPHVRLLTSLDELEAYLSENGYHKQLGGKTRRNRSKH
jgi:hypothetical protein